MTDRFAIVQICDDARFDQRGSLNITGQYIAEATVDRIPVFLPKLTFVVRLRSSDKDRPSKFIVRVEPPGGQPIIHDASAACTPSNPEEGDLLHEVITIFTLAPFEIKGEGKVGVYVIDEQREYYAGSVVIKLANPGVPSIEFVGAELIRRWAFLSSEVSAADRMGLAERMLDAFTKSVFRDLPKVRVPQPTIFLPISANQIIAIFTVPMRVAPSVSVKGVPPEIKWEVRNIDRFSAEIYFPDLDGAIPNFELIVDARM